MDDTEPVNEFNEFQEATRHVLGSVANWETAIRSSALSIGIVAGSIQANVLKATTCQPDVEFPNVNQEQLAVDLGRMLLHLALLANCEGLQLAACANVVSDSLARAVKILGKKKRGAHWHPPVERGTEDLPEEELN